MAWFSAPGNPNAVVTNPTGTQTITLADATALIIKDDESNTAFSVTDGQAGADTIQGQNSNVEFDLIDAGTFTVKDDAGSSILAATDGGGGNSTLVLAASITFTNPLQSVNSQMVNGKFTTYAGANVVGPGIVPIPAAGAQTLYTNAAPTALSLAGPPAGVYMILAHLNILTGATLTFKAKLTYNDAGGNARSDIPVFVQQNSATLLAGGPAANSTGRFSFSYVFSTDGSATIALADNAGTYTAGTYYWDPVLVQLA